MLSAAYTASAQDDVPVPGPSTQNIFNQDPAIYDEKPLMMEQDQRFKSMDSLQHKSATPAAKSKANDPKKAQAEGDPMNFNFLHYIIQRFKASELMME
jgi:hypothetical protein